MTFSLGNTFVDIIFQRILEPVQRNACLLELVKSICTNQRFPQFRRELFERTISLYVTNMSVAAQRDVKQIDVRGFNSLDKQVHQLQRVIHHGTTVRKQRLRHFIRFWVSFGVLPEEGMKLFQIDPFLLNINDVHLANEPLPTINQKILSKQNAQHTLHLEDHLFWVQLKVNRFFAMRLK